jgi:hypothetical protein
MHLRANKVSPALHSTGLISFLSLDPIPVHEHPGGVRWGTLTEHNSHIQYNQLKLAMKCGNLSGLEGTPPHRYGRSPAHDFSSVLTRSTFSLKILQS